MPIIERTFSQVAASDEAQQPQPLSAYFAEPVIVLLGDPGAGKTTAFKRAAQAEANAAHITVRDFLALSPDRWRGKTLYLDGLDEQRAKANDGSAVLDQVRSRLDLLGRPRFRLSCRAADWYGSSDIAALSAVSPSGSLLVLRIDPLSREDMLSIISDIAPDPVAFLRHAERHGVGDLLFNPLTLTMLATVVSDGIWPTTRTDLFEKATELLLRERNEEHARYQAASLPLTAIRDAAEAICTAVLCGGLSGVALSQIHEEANLPFLGNIPHDLTALNVAARRRVFVSVGEERVAPIHRTVAEYLAANHLRSRIREGLPLGRVLAIITGHDGIPVTDLRGCFAWLASLSPEVAEVLIERDPLGVVLYGDAAVLSQPAKLRVLRGLSALAQRDPWFRSETWSGRAFGALASPDLATAIQEVLDDPSHSPGLADTMLDALTTGPPLPSLTPTLLSIVRDATRYPVLRVGALRALLNIESANTSLLTSLLDEVNRGTINDPHRRLRGDLLRHLYPSVISGAQVARYLAPPDPDVVSGYTVFIEYDLVPATPTDAIPALLDDIAQRGQRRGDFPRMRGALLVRALREHGESVSRDRLWKWLSVGLSEHLQSELGSEDLASVRTWLKEHPTVVRSLFSWWMARMDPSELWREHWRFSLRLYGFRLEGSFGRWLLEQAEAEPDTRRAQFLFREAVRTRAYASVPGAPTLDELYAFAERLPRFQAALQEEMRSDIPDWRIDQSREAERHRRRTEESRERTRRDLGLVVDGLRTGQATQALAHLAKVYFGLFIDVDRTLSPMDRLIEYVGVELAASACEGFVAVVRRSDLPSPEQIGLAYANSRHYLIGHAVLAGCDVLWHGAYGGFDAVPAESFRSALAFHYAIPRETPHDWVEWLESNKTPEASRALEEFWRPQLERHATHVPGLAELTTEHMRAIARDVVPKLLSDFSAIRPDTLRRLLSSGIRYCEHERILEIARSALTNRRRVRGAQATLWQAAAFVLSPEEFRPARSWSGLKGRERTFVHFLMSTDDGAAALAFNLPVEATSTLVRIAGRMFAPTELTAGWQPLEGGFLMSRAIEGFIDRLSRDPSPAAGSALAALSVDRSLAAWREVLSHAVAVQARNRREAQFVYPAFRAVVQTLAGGPPANAMDLQALTVSEISDLSNELRHGVTDGYKALWNVDSYGRPDSPRPEDDCRDRLMERLAPRLVQSEVVLEPEGRYAEEKRADIKAISRTLNIPIEIKRHYHKDLWTAPERQLRQLYERDPGTEGRGIYLVLWFGRDFKATPTPPPGVPRPQTPSELETTLSSLVSYHGAALTHCVVLDCARPARAVDSR